MDVYEAILAISKMSGLKPETVEDLLTKGWTYDSKLLAPRSWLGPEAQFGKMEIRHD